MRHDTSTLAGKVRYVMPRLPAESRCDPNAIAEEIARQFYSFLAEPAYAASGYRPPTPGEVAAAMAGTAAARRERFADYKPYWT